MKHLTEMVRQHKAGKTNGIYAVCSAHPLVLEAAIRYASANQTPLLIEATSNQVDQFGGYTGMTPADFRGFVCQLADSLNFPQDALILGGDHLGPNRWQNLPAAQAMANADDLIKSYVAAGFKKIHLDCSMSCHDDPIPLTDDIVAERAARLAKVAEETCLEHFGEADLEYVIGTEVPVPGGAHETLSELAVTTPDAARATLEAHRHAFEKQGLNAIWPRIIALVVQPGVEFDHTNVIDYQPAKASALSQMGITFLFSVMSGVMSRCDRMAENADTRGIERVNYLALLALGTFYFLCAFLPIYFGAEHAKTIIDVLPQRLIDGLGVAGGIMPAIGFAVLLKIMMKNVYIPYFILGFVAAAWLKLPVLAIAAAALAMALIDLLRKSPEPTQPAAQKEEFEDGI